MTTEQTTSLLNSVKGAKNTEAAQLAVVNEQVKLLKTQGGKRSKRQRTVFAQFSAATNLLINTISKHNIVNFSRAQITTKADRTAWRAKLNGLSAALGKITDTQ